MLKLEKLEASAGTFKLSPLDLEIDQGQSHALLGPSGAGKSTILELIVGFREQQAGRIFLNNRSLEHVPAEQRNIGYLPQNLALFPHLTVRENILYGIRCRRKPDKSDLARIDSLTEAMGVKQLNNRKTTYLSGGERQRVALARALAPSPDLLILDEPFSSLNEALRRELWGLLKEMQEAYNVTTLMVTHDLEEAFYFGETVHILIDGCLHQSGPRRHVFDHPATLAAARFLDIKNILSAQVIKKNNETTTLDCADAGIQFTIRNDSHEALNFGVEESLIIGIRPEFMSLNNAFPVKPGESLRLTGNIIEKTETIRGFMLQIRPAGKEGVLKVAVGYHEARSIRLHDEVEVDLPVKHLFFINPELRYKTAARIK